MTDTTKDVAAWTELLGLLPHPEGGYFREIYRSTKPIPQSALPKCYDGDRNYGTSIYYLLNGEDFSAFHKLHSDEIWHFYEGSAVIIYLLASDGTMTELRLGRDVFSGERPQIVLPQDTWFAAEVIDKSSFAVMGCTVSPGFSFSDFVIGKRVDLTTQFPDYAPLIQRLSRG